MKAPRRWSTLFGILFLLTLWEVLPAHPGKAGEPILTGSSSDYRPGKTNPVANPARWCLLAWDMLGDATHNDTNTLMQYWNDSTDDSLSGWKNFSGANGWQISKCNMDAGPVAMAKGRVLTVLRDDAFHGVLYE
jgi:hypothetical protein